MRQLVIGLLILLILMFSYYVIAYNRLQRLINNLEEASSGIDVALIKRFDLISNLVEVVKGYSTHEKDLFRDISKLRSNINDNRELANQQIESTIFRLEAVIENYPQLKASQQYLNIQKNLTNVEEHLQASRRLYNRNVTMLNNVIRQFPTSFIAKNHKIEARKLFAAPNNFKEKPKVNFQ